MNHFVVELPDEVDDLHPMGHTAADALEALRRYAVPKLIADILSGELRMFQRTTEFREITAEELGA